MCVVLGAMCVSGVLVVVCVGWVECDGCEGLCVVQMAVCVV